ncbi:MAG: HD family phosphohydrolase [Methylocystaceae bacterium]
MSSARSIGRWLLSRLLGLWKRTRIRRYSCYFLVGLVLSLLVISRYTTSDLQLKPGQVSPRDISSPVTSVITDDKKTEELRSEAASRVKKVYQEDNQATAQSLKSIDDFYFQITSIRTQAGTDKEKEARLASYLSERASSKSYDWPSGITAAKLARYLYGIPNTDLQKMHDQTAGLITLAMQNSVTSDTLPQVIKITSQKIGRLSFASEAKQVMILSVVCSLQPNLVFDLEATQAAINTEVARVQPVQRTILQGQSILRSGDVVTDEDIEILQKLGLQRTHNRWLVVAGSLVFVILLMLLSTVFLRSKQREIYQSDRRFMLLALIFLIIVVLARAITMIKLGSTPEINGLIGFLVPVAAGSMLVAILLDVSLAYYITALMAIFAGLMAESNGLSVAFSAYIGGMVGVLSVSRINQTSDLARAGIYLALANLAAVLGITLITNNVTPNVLLVSVIIAVLNGLLSAVLMIGLLPYLEAGFAVTSMIKLLEMSNPNQELLKRLLMEAPGTYHHSIMVGNLAESAAPVVHAEPLLVRVGALYHDIGKTKRPYFFVENQTGYDSPHEKIAPSLSALIITSHIRDGLEMAREKKMPAPILDIIEQHHGTSLVKYFYSRALEEDREGAVHEDTFRYEGPKPQTKEAALIMLADTVEAGVRSLPDPTPGKIEGMVRKLIKDKLNDGQLEECDLTFRDLNNLAEAFSKALVGIYHKRIEYPEVIARDLERKGDEYAASLRKPTK